MTRRVWVAMSEWWRHLAYCNGHTTPDGKVRTWGVRPYRGGPFLWFIVDRSNTAEPMKREEVTT
jgi:hypothetical protein